MDAIASGSVPLNVVIPVTAVIRMLDMDITDNMRYIVHTPIFIESTEGSSIFTQFPQWRLQQMFTDKIQTQTNQSTLLVQ